jgi:GNAT superfamily N-acetyltransferase
MALILRTASVVDLAVVVEFNRRLAEESEGKTLDPAVLSAGVAAVLQDPHKGLYFLAETDGEVLGQVGITYEWSDWRNGWMWWIQSVYVRPEARRRGVFRALFENIQEAALADPEVIGLRLYVDRANHDAQQTYLRMGMQPTTYFVLQRYPLKNEMASGGR